MGNLTVKESGEMVNIISPNVNNITSFKVHFSPKQEGDGDPSPENVREIVGWNGITIKKCGKNLLNPALMQYSTSATSQSWGRDITNNKANGDLILPVGTYTLSITGLPSKPTEWRVVDSDGNYLVHNYSGYLSRTFTLPKRMAIGIYMSASAKEDYSALHNGVMLEADSIATKYEPYNNVEIPIEFPTTIYGGYVDLISGELVAEYEYMTDTWGNWGILSDCGDGTELRYRKFTNAIVGNSAGNGASYCNVAKYNYNNENGKIHFYIVSPSTNCRIYLPSGTDESLQIQVVGKLVEPIHYQLTPQQLSTLKGQNNFWSNADYIELEYELTETFDIQEAKRKIILNQPHVESMSGDIATFNTDMTGKLKECKINFLPVQEGEGDPSPENIRNITGWNGTEIFACGKNLVNVSAETRAYADASGTNTIKFTENDSIITIFGGANGGYQVPCKPNTQYTYSFESSLNRGGFYIRVWELEEKYNGVKIPSGTLLINQNINSSQGSVTTFTTKASTHYLIIGFYVYSTAAETAAETGITVSNFQLELGDTRTSYEPYQGINTSIDWTDSAGTIYGGYIDLISGELVQEWKKVYIKDYTWSNYSAKLRYYISLRNDSDSNNKQNGTPIYTDTLTSRNDGRFSSADVGYITYYEQVPSHINQTYVNYIWTTLPEAMEYAEANEWIKTTYPDASIVYKLETPIIYQLTPQQLTTLRGINNIWSSANGEVEIKFWTH